MVLGARIKSRLAELNKKQAWLARAVGLHQSTINGIVNKGQRSSSYIVAIAKALETTPEYLLGETDNPAVDPALISSLPVEQAELLANFRAMPAIDRTALFQISRTLASLPAPTLPDEDALAQMFEALLMGIDRSQPLAAQALLLAQRLPIGLSQLQDLQPIDETSRGDDQAAEVAATPATHEPVRQ